MDASNIVPSSNREPYYKRTGSLIVDLDVALEIFTKSIKGCHWIILKTLSTATGLAVSFHRLVPWEIWSTVLFYILFRMKYHARLSNKTVNAIYMAWYVFYTSRTFLKCFATLLALVPLWRVVLGDIVVVKIVAYDFIYVWLFVCVWLLLHSLSFHEAQRRRIGELYMSLPSEERQNFANDDSQNSQEFLSAIDDD